MLNVRTKRAIIGIFFAILAGLTIVFSIGRFFAARALERQLAVERASLIQPDPLVITVRSETRERMRTLPARAEPWWRTTLAPEVGGRVTVVRAEPGTSVHAGDTLLELDATVARATLEAAEAAEREAARKAAELQRLAADRVTTPTELEAARAAAEITAREAERARAVVGQYRLIAPFSGRVANRLVDPGDHLNPGQPAIEIVAIDPLRLVFHAAEREAQSLAPGASIKVAFPSLPGKTVATEVLHRAPAAGADGLFRIEAELPNSEGAIPGGLAAVVTARITLYSDILFVPAAAVRFEGARPVVRRLKPDGSEETVAVVIDPEVNGAMPVLSGLNEGDRLVIR